jgi:hypothetical protein
MCIVPPATPGSKTPFDERYNAFFIDYSLTPLLVQHNYIDSAKNGIFKNPGLDDVTRMQMLSRASDAVSDRCVRSEGCCVFRERAAPAAVFHLYPTIAAVGAVAYSTGLCALSIYGTVWVSSVARSL